MIINNPTTAQIPQLKNLWQQAFGDTDAFIDGFFNNAFFPDRCRCITLDDRVVAALYWFDCQNLAYLYAVATEKAHRGKGLCRKLMEDTRKHLTEKGYAGAVLVPAEEGLWQYYGSMGYRPFGHLRSFTAQAGAPILLKEIDAAAYCKSRKASLPDNALQEENAIGYYGTWGKFYQGNDCLFAAAADGDTLYVQEFLGNAEKAPGIVAALGCREGIFRAVGGREHCGMYLLFENCAPPAYLGFPLD